MRLSPNFTLVEAMKSQTAERRGIDNEPPEDVIPRLRQTAHLILEPVRAHYGMAFSPSSWYRSPELNRAIGGASQSQHIDGYAVDFELPGVSNYDLACWIRDNLSYDQLILECYQPSIPMSGWVHASYTLPDKSLRGSVLTYSNGQYQQGLIP